LKPEINIAWKPEPRQELALGCPAFELGFGGSKGGGKTDFLVASPIPQIQLAHQMWIETGQQQRGRAIIFRKNIKNLADITVRCKELYPLIDPNMGLGGWNKIERKWTFSSGYTVELAHLNDPDDHLGYNGQEITALLFDQAEELPEDVIDFLIMQVRSSNPRMRELLMVRYTANPGGPYGAWFKKRFIEGCKPYGSIVREHIKLRSGKTKEVTRAFLESRLEDNKYLAESGDYEARIRRLPLHMQKMYLDGDWDVVVGAFLSHVWDRSVHVRKSFSIPSTWDLKMGGDWGSTAPACVLVGAKDHDGNVWIIDELYTPGISGRTFGEKLWRKFERQKWSLQRRWEVQDIYMLMDRGARANSGADGRYSNPSAGIASWGFRIFDANKDRAAGNEQVIERLLRGPDGKPSLYIFEDRCPNLVRTLPLLMADPHDPEDVATTGEDHAFDSIKYLLLDWPVQKRYVKKDQDVERWMRIAEERANRREPRDDISTGYGD
jgi:hypothetical protein